MVNLQSLLGYKLIIIIIMSNLKKTTQSTINALIKKGQKDKAKQIKTDIEAMYGIKGLRLPKV